MSARVTILDAAIGTRLIARGTPLAKGDDPRWTPEVLLDDPARVAALHSEDARAGAHILTAWTFRTRPDLLGDRWETAVRTAVRIARDAAEAVTDRPRPRVFASIGPLADCYRPQDSPVALGRHAEAERAHAAIADILLDTGAEGLLCETFAHPDEGILAATASLEAVSKAGSSAPVWLSLTPGYRGDLMTPDMLAGAASRAAEAGVGAVLVNCLPAREALAWVRALRAGVPPATPIGARANSGAEADGLGWGVDGGAARFAAIAEDWIEAGASIVGGCCGTEAAHTEALAGLVRGR